MTAPETGGGERPKDERRAAFIEDMLRAWLRWSEEPACNWKPEDWGRVFMLQRHTIAALAASASPHAEDLDALAEQVLAQKDRPLPADWPKRLAADLAEAPEPAAPPEGEEAPHFFDKLGADRLADEVAVLVRRHIIDARSPAGDALLDYRDPPSTPRADRLAELESEITRLRSGRDAAVQRAEEAEERRYYDHVSVERIIGAARRVLAETGCDGDLCAHEWHEELRLLLSEAEEMAQGPKPQSKRVEAAEQDAKRVREREKVLREALTRAEKALRLAADKFDAALYIEDGAACRREEEIARAALASGDADAAPGGEGAPARREGVALLLDHGSRAICAGPAALGARERGGAAAMMTNRADCVDVTVERVKRATDKALLVVVEGEEVWIPRAEIHDDSEVWDEGHEGTLVIPLWLAEKKGLA